MNGLLDSNKNSGRYADLSICCCDVPASLAKIALAMAGLYSVQDWKGNQDSVLGLSVPSLQYYTCSGIPHNGLRSEADIYFVGCAELQDPADLSNEATVHAYIVNGNDQSNGLTEATAEGASAQLHTSGKELRHFIREALRPLCKSSRGKLYDPRTHVNKKNGADLVREEFRRSCANMYSGCPIASNTRDSWIAPEPSHCDLSEEYGLRKALLDGSVYYNPEVLSPGAELYGDSPATVTSPPFFVRIHARGWRIPGALALMICQLLMRPMPSALANEYQEEGESILAGNIAHISNLQCNLAAFNVKRIMLEATQARDVSELIARGGSMWPELKECGSLRDAQRLLFQRMPIRRVELICGSPDGHPEIEKYYHNLRAYLQRNASEGEYVESDSEEGKYILELRT